MNSNFGHSNWGYDDAKYSIRLRTMMENEQLKPLLEKAMSTYPIYTPTNKMTYSLIPTREQLNNKILNHYKYRELGFETIGRFLDELEISLNEIMPYYYQLFKSQDIMNGIEDPFGNVDITEKFEERTTGESTGESTGNLKSTSSSNNNSESENNSETENKTTTNTELTNNDKNVKSTTPQGILNIGTKDINTIKHANEANWNEALSNSEGTTEDKGTTTNKETSKDESSMNSESQSSGKANNRSEGTTEHTFTKKGNQGVNTYAHDMKELRTIFLNIEQMIINDERISELFLRIW